MSYTCIQVYRRFISLSINLFNICLYNYKYYKIINLRHLTVRRDLGLCTLNEVHTHPCINACIIIIAHGVCRYCCTLFHVRHT